MLVAIPLDLVYGDQPSLPSSKADGIQLKGHNQSVALYLRTYKPTFLDVLTTNAQY